MWTLPREVLGLYWSRDSRTFHLNLLGLSLVGSVTVLPALFLSGVAVLAGWSQARARQDVAALRVENARLGDSAIALADQVRLLDAMDRIAGKARNPQFRAMMAREIDRNARLYDFDPLLILAVVTVESRLDPAARGQYRSGAASGALGIMQVKPSTARGVAAKLGVEMAGDHALFDPELNLAVGVGYLLQMIYRYRDLRLGIMAYNVGPGNLELALHGGAELPHGYYRKVLAQYRRLKET